MLISFKKKKKKKTQIESQTTFRETSKILFDQGTIASQVKR